jgi:hypothetical protein
VSLSSVIRANSCFTAQADDEPGGLLKRSSLQAIQAIKKQEIKRSSDRPVMSLRQTRVRAVSDPPHPSLPVAIHAGEHSDELQATSKLKQASRPTVRSTLVTVDVVPIETRSYIIKVTFIPSVTLEADQIRSHQGSVIRYHRSEYVLVSDYALSSSS